MLEAEINAGLVNTSSRRERVEEPGGRLVLVSNPIPVRQLMYD